MTGAAPPALGRGLVVLPAQDVPAAWRSADRVVVDDRALAAPRATADRLHRAWTARRPVVVELAVDQEALREPEVSTRPVWAHDADFLFHRERLHHLVWANTYDHRTGDLRWWHVVKARRAGLPLEDGGPADALLDDRPVWIDGGPRQPLDVGDAVLLHRQATERGLVRPMGRHADPPVRGLAPDQREAVTAATGAVRVAAPAGSGKTRVLTARLRELLEGRGIEPEAVLALAYNADAARELRARTRGLGTRATTIHAYALDVLRRHRGEVTVLEEPRVRELLARLVPADRQANTDPYAPWIEALERVRVALVPPEQVEKERDDVPGLPRVLQAYRERLAALGAVDFPEMVYRALELLLTDPSARRVEQAAVGQVLVDEFQDLTPAYLLLIRLVAAPGLQVFGVGDEDQVIYGHAGATPEFLLGYPDLFPGAEDHPLEVNHRCPPRVVAAATALLGHNRRRLDKTIRAAPGRRDPDGVLDVRRVAPAAQAATTAAVVTGWLAQGRDPADCAVLARVNVALLPVQVALHQAGVPHRSPIGEWLLDRTGVRAALTYLRLSAGEPFAGDDLAEILYRPLRGVPGAMRDVLRGRRWTVRDLREAGGGRLAGRAGRAWDDFVRDLDVLVRRAGRQPTSEVLRYVRDVIGVGDAARTLDESAGQQIGASHADDLDALLQIADHCPDAAAFPAFLRAVVAQPPPEGPAVRLSSVHKVKGLQWPCVVVVGAAEGVSPHRLALTAAQLEEERRVWHVAITRAAEQLAVVAPRTATSRFVAEMLGEEKVIAPTAGPRGTRRTSRRGAATDDARFRAVTGLEVSASGGLNGSIEQVTDDGALIRTARGSLLRLDFGSAVKVDGQRGRLVRP